MKNLIKKLLLYSIIFVCVAGGTCICAMYIKTDGFKKPEIIIPEKTPIENTNIIEDSEDNKVENIISTPEIDTEMSPIFSITKNALSNSSYSGNFRLTSSDDDVNINGTFKYRNFKPCQIIDDFDISKIALEVNLSGTYKTINFDVKITYINSTFYIDYNNLHLITTIDELKDTISQIIPGTESEINFDTSSLDEYLETLTITESNDLKFISINLPIINKLSITCDKNYNIKNISAYDINILNKHFSLSCFTTNKLVTISKPNKSEYTNLNNYVPIVKAITNSLNNFPISYSGKITLLNYDLDVLLTISKDYTISAKLTYEDIDIKVQIKNNNIYIDALGLRICDSTDNFIKFIKDYFDFNLDLNFEIHEDYIKFNNETFLFFNIKDDVFKNIDFESQFLDIQLVKTAKKCTFSLTDYKSIKLNDLKPIIDFFSGNEFTDFSLNVSAYIGDHNFDFNTYIYLNNNHINKLYLSGNLDGKNLLAVSDSKDIYVNYENIKLKLSEFDINNCLSKIKELFNFDFEVPNISYNEIPSLIKSQIKRLSFSNSTLQIVLTNDVTILFKFESSQITISVVNLYIQSNKSCFVIKLYNDNLKYSSIINEVNESDYLDVKDPTDFAYSVINTFNKDCVFNGNINVNIWGIKLTSIGINLKTYYKNGIISAEIELDNLPCLASITDLNIIKYTSQSTKIKIENDYIRITRTAKRRFKDTTETMVNYKIKISEISLKTIKDIFGFSDHIYNQISSISESSNEIAKDLIDNDTVNFMDNTLLLNLKTSSLLNLLSDCVINIYYNNNEVSKIYTKLDFIKILSFDVLIEKQ